MRGEALPSPRRTLGPDYQPVAANQSGAPLTIPAKKIVGAMQLLGRSTRSFTIASPLEEYGTVDDSATTMPSHDTRARAAGTGFVPSLDPAASTSPVTCTCSRPSANSNAAPRSRCQGRPPALAPRNVWPVMVTGSPVSEASRTFWPPAVAATLPPRARAPASPSAAAMRIDLD